MNVDINDIIKVLKGFEIALYKKTFSKEEVDEYFPAWNNLTSVLDKIKRNQQIYSIYPEVPQSQQNQSSINT